MEVMHRRNIQRTLLGGRSGFGNPQERPVCHALKLEFPATNNEAEYDALIAGLKIAKELRVKGLHIYSDSIGGLLGWERIPG